MTHPDLAQPGEPETQETMMTLASLLPIADGMAAINRWKAERTVAWWSEFDHAIQTIVAEAIRLWPKGDTDGLLKVVRLSMAVMAETAGTMGIPDRLLPFTVAPQPEPGEGV